MRKINKKHKTDVNKIKTSTTAAQAAGNQNNAEWQNSTENSNNSDDKLNLLSLSVKHNIWLDNFDKIEMNLVKFVTAAAIKVFCRNSNSSNMFCFSILTAIHNEWVYNDITGSERERESERNSQCKQIEINEARWAIKQSIFFSSLCRSLPRFHSSDDHKQKMAACSAVHIELQCILQILCVRSFSKMLNVNFVHKLILQAGICVCAGRQAV